MSSLVVAHALKRASSEMDGKYYLVDKKSGAIEKISYNTVEIEKFKNRLTEIIQEEFVSVEKGEFHDYPLGLQEKMREKYPFFQNGYLCEISLSSLQKSSLFAYYGPIIPIKLSFMGYVDTNISLQVREYGINNVIVEVDVEVLVHNMITMPISSRIHSTKVRQVLSLDIIQGEVPNYYHGVLG